MMNIDRSRSLAVAFFSSCLFAQLAAAQAGQWTWMKGPQAPGGDGVYGTQGVAAPANHPPGCVNQYNWTAQDGTFWLFGGQDNDGRGLAALWKYDPTTNLWTWVKGPSSYYFEGDFGVQGVESPTNLPPAKTFGGASWVDLDGNFWMYGGENGENYNLDSNNDLWRFNPTTNNWTWMKGSTADNPPAVWGTLGVPDINNQPPARTTCYGTWVDDQGDLWMFGGMMPPPMDDLWRYNIASNTWTWMNGSQTPDAVAVYGALGVQAASNTPGARIAYALGKDADGMMWMQGGALGAGFYGWGDVWRLDPASGEWTWMSGSASPNPPVSTGAACVQNSANDPGKRVNSPTWQTQDGRMWTFGVVSSSGNPNFNFSRNDLWTFCPATLTWTWVHGPAANNDAGNWGTQGVASPSNRPNGRQMPSAWVAQNGDLYLFGGNPLGAFTTYGDLWRFVPDPGCGACVSTNVQEAFGPGVFTLVPNPTESGPVRLILPDGSWSIEVLDMIGRHVMSFNANGSTSLECDHLPIGSYSVVARSTRGSHTARLLIAR